MSSQDSRRRFPFSQQSCGIHIVSYRDEPHMWLQEFLLMAIAHTNMVADESRKDLYEDPIDESTAGVHHYPLKSRYIKGCA